MDEKRSSVNGNFVDIKFTTSEVHCNDNVQVDLGSMVRPSLTSPSPVGSKYMIMGLS